MCVVRIVWQSALDCTERDRDVGLDAALHEPATLPLSGRGIRASRTRTGCFEVTSLSTVSKGTNITANINVDIAFKEPCTVGFSGTPCGTYHLRLGFIPTSMHFRYRHARQLLRDSTKTIKPNRRARQRRKHGASLCARERTMFLPFVISHFPPLAHAKLSPVRPLRWKKPLHALNNESNMGK